MPATLEHEYSNPPWTRSQRFAQSLSDRELDWGQRHVNLPDAFKVARGAGMKICVIDTGCDVRHPDLVNQIVDVRNFTDSPYQGVTDRNGHGTHVAGTIAAEENDRGVIGYCPDLRKNGGGLYIAKALGDDGSGRMEWIAAAVYWAIEQKVHIISMSLGATFNDPRLAAAIRAAVESGIFVICAAGNDGRNSKPNYPGALRDITFAVASIQEDGTLSPFSSWGPHVDIAAPGSDVLSTFPGGKYMRLSGTSMSAPAVSGVVGLLLSTGQGPTTNQGLRTILRDTADDLGKPGKDIQSGFGLINPAKMLPKERPPADKKPRLYLGGWMSSPPHPKHLRIPVGFGLPPKGET